MKILVTGFLPFNGEKMNPSELLLAQLRDHCAGVKLLPVEYQGSFVELEKILRSGAYDGVLMLGQAAGRKLVSLEKVALNWEECEFPDEAGVQSSGFRIDGNGDDAIINSLPITAWQKALKAQGLPVEVSFSAGSFVCNSLYYRVVREIQFNPKFPRWALFVHVPYLPEQMDGKPSGTPSMPLAKMTEVLRALLALVASEKNLRSG